MPQQQSMAGWILIYDLKGQCGNCAHVVHEQKMAACDCNRKDFGNAHDCPVFRYTWEDAE